MTTRFQLFSRLKYDLKLGMVEQAYNQHFEGKRGKPKGQRRLHSGTLSQKSPFQIASSTVQRKPHVHKEKETRPLSFTLHKNQLQMDQRSTVKLEILQLLEEKVARTLQYRHKRGLSKQNFSCLGNTAIRKLKYSVQGKKQPSEAHRIEEIFASYISDRIII